MEIKSNSYDVSEWARAPPPAGSVWSRLGKMIYNSGDGSFLGRTPKRWAIVLVFYAVFYLVLALLFAACMGGLFLTLDPARPTYVLDRSLIGSNPGVTIKPNNYILFNVSDPEDYREKIKELQTFLDPYMNSTLLQDNATCTAHDNFGYPDGPCVYIKVNKLFDWKPECYDEISQTFPADVPEDLRAHVVSFPAEEREQVWVSCWEMEAHNETTIEYPWGRGLDAKMFPFTNQNGYLSPILAIKVTTPVDRLTIIMCRAWAKNIQYNKSIKEPSGYALLVLRLARDTRYVSKRNEQG